MYLTEAETSPVQCIKLLASNLSVQNRESVYLPARCLRENLESPNKTTRGGRVFLNCISSSRLGVTSSVCSQAPRPLPAPLPVLGSEDGGERERAALTSGRSMRKQWRRASWWQRETGTGTNTGTVHSATETDLQRPENLEEELSLSLSLLLRGSHSRFRYALIWQKSDTLDCVLLLASGPMGGGSERHRVVGKGTGIF